MMAEAERHGLVLLASSSGEQLALTCSRSVESSSVLPQMQSWSETEQPEVEIPVIRDDAAHSGI